MSYEKCINCIIRYVLYLGVILLSIRNYLYLKCKIAKEIISPRIQTVLRKKHGNNVLFLNFIVNLIENTVFSLLIVIFLLNHKVHRIALFTLPFRINVVEFC